jgi:lysophospholipase L1-like esterase
MRYRSISIAFVALGVLAGTFAATPSGAEPGTTASAAATSGRVYLALGDSLAASFQVTGETRDGYAEQLHQLEQAGIPDLRLVKLGCPGERTSTIDRSRRACPYEAGSQLDQAIATLETEDVAFVTLQIGSNDTFHCFDFRAGAFDEPCVDALLPKLSDRLTSIVERLRAADPDVPIVGANYYDPLLALWTAPGFPEGGVRSVDEVWTRVNDTIEQTYGTLGVPVADQQAAFSGGDFDTVVHARGWGDLPLNVARICVWTSMCETEGVDTHPTTVGYAILTRAWESTLAEPAP